MIVKIVDGSRLITMFVPLPKGDEVTTGSAPIRSGIGGPVIGELQSLYWKGDYLMGTCVRDGKLEVIKLAHRNVESCTVTWDARFTGIQYEGPGQAYVHGEIR